MVTLAVAAILLTVAVPSFQALLANNRLTAQANDLVAAFGAARSEAIKRGAEIRVYAGSGSDWASGWTLRVDANRDGDYTDAGEPLKPSPAVTGSSAAQGLGHSLTNANYVAFNSRGEITPATDRFEIVISATSATETRCVAVERTGRGFVEKDLGATDITECER